MYPPPTELKNADRHCRFYCDRAISCLAAPPLLHQTNHRMNSRVATASFLNNILLLSSDTGVYYWLMGQMKDAGLVRFCCLENGEKSQNAAETAEIGGWRHPDSSSGCHVARIDHDPPGRRKQGHDQRIPGSPWRYCFSDLGLRTCKTYLLGGPPRGRHVRSNGYPTHRRTTTRAAASRGHCFVQSNLRETSSILVELESVGPIHSLSHIYHALPKACCC